jgi:hypothetical protein
MVVTFLGLGVLKLPHFFNRLLDRVNTELSFAARTSALAWKK